MSSSTASNDFPELGSGPKPVANVAPVWLARTPEASAPGSGTATPAPETVAASTAATAPSLSIPGQHKEYLLLHPDDILPREQLKRPIADVIKDFNRKSRAQIKVIPHAENMLRIEATGPKGESTTQTLKDFVGLVGAKLKLDLEVPRWARPHIIGRGGATIKQIQDKTGARIQVPREDGQAAPEGEDDEELIKVIIEGNTQQAAHARNLIYEIMGERAGTVSLSVKDVPAEFYPFIAGPDNEKLKLLEEEHHVTIKLPTARPFSSAPPARSEETGNPVFSSAADSAIQVRGDRYATKNVRTKIDQQVQELRNQLTLEIVQIQHGRHQFIIGNRGVSMDQFFQETGCTIVLPEDVDEDDVYIVGPPSQVAAGVQKTIDLAMGMQCSNIDISRFHRQAPGGAAVHARNVTRYLQQKRELERVGNQHGVHFNTPYSEQGALPWEIYARDGSAIVKAQSEVKSLVDAHPPTRVATVAIDPFYHQYVRKEVAPYVRQTFGVHVVVPEAAEASAPILLVYERASGADGYQVAREAPKREDLPDIQKGLQGAQSHIQSLLSEREPISSKTIEVPVKFHSRLQKFIKNEQDAAQSTNGIRARVSNTGESVHIRGPTSVVDSLVAKCVAFVEQEKQDETERGHITEFDFPQKYANHLIGKGGSNIRELREKFDVEITVNDGKVQLKGPKAKAEAAKTHINSLARQLQDEATHIVKIDPKFHREIIGAQGAQINRLQTRYKVLIFFPRNNNKNNKDDESADSASEAGKPRRQQAADEVIIRGPKRGADEARDELLSLLQYLKDTSFTATVTVQKKQLPSLIGSGGAVLEQLRQSTGAKIDVPSAKESTEELVDIQIKGTKAEVAAAKKVLEEKKAIFDDTVIKRIEVPRKYHRSLIGAGGATLRDIVVKAGGSDDQRELARTIQFPKQDADGDSIKVEGRSEIVDKIVARIEAIVAERESQVTESVEVPVEKHRSIVGRGGETKRGIEEQFKVSIDVPRQGSGKTSVKIVGQQADVEKAKAHLEEFTKEQPGETVQVPRALHHIVSNNGGIFRKFRNDFGITVDHAGQAVPPRPAAPSNARSTNGGALPLITDDEDTAADVHSWNIVEQGSSSDAEDGDIPWVLRGSPENIEKAKKAIQTALDQASKQTATGYLVLPDPRTYRFVIGQGGSKVNAIRKQSGCKITVPRDQNQGDAIEVVGSREGVEKAKDLILAAVQEGLSNAGPRTPRE
ncbi:uncharacterized protein C8A04DRAFT_24725 [Dichotomopilus funicola]|uniref:K Homology domain-containing protein n=1 Tax=Dichotomopilus funicola TaxID=1934379 RepID=A0AAN6ZRF5_9PEZI|nr:hypothetical protein C8A04DRAFT_24725 [Dichotomopilus funicola]